MKYKLKSGNILVVSEQEYAESPDTWGNTDVFLVYEHRDFTIRREGFEPKNIHDHLYDGVFEDETYDDYCIFAVDAYIHSGVHLSLANTENYPDNRRWDVSTTGFVLVRKNCVPDEEQAAHSLIETWNQYLSGDVWGFQVLKPIKTYTITEEDLLKTFKNRMNRTINVGLSEIIEKSFCNTEYEELDSCWGFYGSDPKENGIIDHIDDEIIEEIEDV